MNAVVNKSHYGQSKYPHQVGLEGVWIKRANIKLTEVCLFSNNSDYKYTHLLTLFPIPSKCMDEKVRFPHMIPWFHDEFQGAECALARRSLKLMSIFARWWSKRLGKLKYSDVAPGAVSI